MDLRSKFPNSASALRLAVLFGLEGAALALGHHANLDTSYGLFPTLGLLDIAGFGLALVLVGEFWTCCIADSGAPRQIVVRLEQYPCSTTSRISRPRKPVHNRYSRLDAHRVGSLRPRFEPTFETQLDRLSSLGLRPVPRRLLYLPGFAGRRGLGRALDIDAALIEPEWRVAVGHQRHINQQPVAPPIDSKCKVKKARRITRCEQQRDGRDQHTRADQAGSGIADGTPVLHACGHDITGADKRTDDEILRKGEQPLDQRQPTIQLLRVLEVQPFGVVGDIGESERRIPVGTQRRITVKAHPPRPPNHPDIEVEQPFRIPGREQNREEGDHGDYPEREPQENQNDVVRDQQQPLDQPQRPAGLIKKAPHGKWVGDRRLVRGGAHGALLGCGGPIPALITIDESLDTGQRDPPSRATVSTFIAARNYSRTQKDLGTRGRITRRPQLLLPDAEVATIDSDNHMLPLRSHLTADFVRRHQNAAGHFRPCPSSSARNISGASLVSRPSSRRPD